MQIIKLFPFFFACIKLSLIENFMLQKEALSDLWSILRKIGYFRDEKTGQKKHEWLTHTNPSISKSCIKKKLT